MVARRPAGDQLQQPAALDASLGAGAHYCRLRPRARIAGHQSEGCRAAIQGVAKGGWRAGDEVCGALQMQTAQRTGPRRRQ